ncbi:putative membrane protein [Bacteroides fragilis str. J38-1]|nr:putative membrane protein [Bacteroides fragilis str. J38-1]
MILTQLEQALDKVLILIILEYIYIFILWAISCLFFVLILIILEYIYIQSYLGLS